jgi:hypothetical protein
VEIEQLAQEADQSEKEVDSEARLDFGAGAVASPAPPSAPASIALGQTVAEVTAALGQPKSVVDLGTKKIYVYLNMKITFVGGKVINVQ